VFAILHNIALISCKFDISVEDDTYYGSRTDLNQNLYPAQHICFFGICIDMEGLFARQIPGQVFIAT